MSSIFFIFDLVCYLMKIIYSNITIMSTQK
nr:MAG TPA: hypothetical protein [Caudoviricetes sp.]